MTAEVIPAPELRVTTSSLSWANRWDHFLARWAVRRNDHRVAPGLYALGEPTPQSPVFVTANYTLSFDALRSALAGIDCYILALDTRGINVWCAAGKGTFSTDEVVRKVETTGLRDFVAHRTLILPQLGAPGVAAHEVKRRTGFKVEYGPARAEDLPRYMRERSATPEMRRARFDMLDRVVLIPVELVATLVPLIVAMALLFFLGGWLSVAVAVASVVAGLVLFPVLLPWLPTRDFSTKGLILGALVSLPLVVAQASGAPDAAWWVLALRGLPFVMGISAVTAFLALNFTGSTTFTSRTGVRREIFRYVPVMAVLFVGAVALSIAHSALRITGVL